MEVSNVNIRSPILKTLQWEKKIRPAIPHPLFSLRSIIYQVNCSICPCITILKDRESCFGLLAKFCQKQITSFVKDLTTGGKLSKKLTETANRYRTERSWWMLLFAVKLLWRTIGATWCKPLRWIVNIGVKYVDVWLMSSTQGLALCGDDEIIGPFHNKTILFWLNFWASMVHFCKLM